MDLQYRFICFIRSVLSCLSIISVFLFALSFSKKKFKKKTLLFFAKKNRGSLVGYASLGQGDRIAQVQPTRVDAH